MRDPVFRVNGDDADASAGRVTWAPAKSVWNGSMIATAVMFAPLMLRIDAVLLFAITTYLTLLLGHSVGMHRKLIHRSFYCPKWLERVLVYLGVLVGMSGPFGIMRIHDIRDWAQREPACHDFYAHRRSLAVDACWQLFFRFECFRPPLFVIEPEVHDDIWYRWMERTWMLQQFPLALVFYLIGGWAWVVWGIAVRVSVSVTGHWVVTYLTHNPGPGRWRIPGAGVQASNLSGYGLLTMGECWHNNHHAFPESARMGLQRTELDPGWWVLRALYAIGFVSRIGLPRPEARRDDLALTP